MYEIYLAHHGILGQKWGIRRFQNKDGSLTSAGSKRYGVGDSSSPRHKPSSARKLAKQRAANLEKARQAKAAKKEFEEGKKKALESGSAADVLKYKGHLSNQELQNAFNRINLESQLSSMAQKDVKTGWDKADDIMNKVGKLTDYSNKAIGAYNVLAKINNSFSENKMQPIDGVGKKAKEAKSRYDQLIKSGSVEDVLRAIQSGKLTKAEREAAVARLKDEQTLSNMIKNNQSSNNSASESTTRTNKDGRKSPSSDRSTATNESAHETASQAHTSTSGSSNHESHTDTVDVFTPKPGRDYSTQTERRSARENEQRAKEWASKKARENRDFYEASWTDVVDTSSTSAGRDYANNASFMTLPTGQVIPLLPEHKN